MIDSKKLAVVASVLVGGAFIAVIFLLASVGVFLYEMNPAMPGIMAFGIVGVWAAHDFTYFLNQWIITYFCNRDLKQGRENA